MALTDKLSNIANAIRAKTGNTDALTLDQMVSEIDSIQTGGGDSSLVDSIIDRSIVEIESSVSRIGDNSFYKCTELLTASFPYASSIGDNALRDCVKLTDVYIPNATILRGGCMRGDQNIKKLDLPKVDTMFANVFTGCTRLETIVLRSTTQCSMSNANVLASTPIEAGTGYVYVPTALVDAYKEATNWSTYASQIRAIEDYPDITGG